MSSPTDMSDRSKEDYHDETRLQEVCYELRRPAFPVETEARDLMITRREEYFKYSHQKKLLGPNSNGTGQFQDESSASLVCLAIVVVWLPVQGWIGSRVKNEPFMLDTVRDMWRGSRYRWLLWIAFHRPLRRECYARWRQLLHAASSTPPDASSRKARHNQFQPSLP